ncbi:zinc-binding dehydrogenase [Corynebacterium flavescens]|uniref:zinc-binding dehydrogenase n=1 Tax=Corynebacterium flavescens TaxID=28028 RepID=UPI000EBCB084|nr:zinc-binding dehydrogenase [Corynebacterium flavescens]MDN6099654.1 zinc-binding dehydrogenase [Corynebacterium flavescens]MDN6431597.1 zinc-binding dehydrogenase [Corynebacterium flavescens]MDN6476090.1 zinc-binding dehydrogenase [Corynebacterium flavescens]MDN6532212.1 zinc-binding dehydrogenase [Corynebacterium flavescens]MDN6553127.1 zinc-binding dehydrogenase [Corynebacterium flavescens]
MRALIHDSFGEPQDVLHVEERPLPEPGPGQIRLRVRLSPIHNHDIWTIRGTYGFKPELPAPAGTEVLGVVDKLGEGVTGIEVGQRGVSGTSFGVWGDYALVDVAGFIPVPEQLPDEAAAQLVSMPFSALSLLDFLDVEAGDWVVQNSANGAVGRMLAQLARARGVNVLGLVRRNEGIEELKAQGIDTVVSTADPKWREQAAEITGGAPIRAGVDSVGGQSSGQVLSLLAQGGTLVVFGAMAGPTMELPSGPIIFRNLKVKGFWGSQVSRDMDPAKKQGLFAELMQRISAGELTLPVAGVFGPEELPAAIDAHFTPGRVGKVLLQF